MIDHDHITSVMLSQGPIGTGVTPNPFTQQQSEWMRRIKFASDRIRISGKIESLFEPRHITPPETSECIEAIVTMTDARKILEVGTHTGFTALHILRAIIGKDGGKLVSVDYRPAHDQGFWDQFSPVIEFVNGMTPEILTDPRITTHAPYDLVFVDSDHSVDHTRAEVDALWQVTRTGSLFLFHDLPEWHTPDSQQPPPVRSWVLEQVASGRFSGLILPTCEQLDCRAVFGPNYPKQLNPHLGCFMRR